jgi:hypothetical protein
VVDAGSVRLSSTSQMLGVSVWRAEKGEGLVPGPCAYIGDVEIFFVEWDGGTDLVSCL